MADWDFEMLCLLALRVEGYCEADEDIPIPLLQQIENLSYPQLNQLRYLLSLEADDRFTDQLSPGIQDHLLTNAAEGLPLSF